MNTKTDLSAALDEALRRFEREPNNRPGDGNDRKLGSLIEEITGGRLPDGASTEIKKDMRQRKGAKCLSNSGDIWNIEP